MRINAINLYYFIIKNLDDNEIAEPDFYSDVIYDKFYYNHNKNTVNVRVPSYASFLLSQLYKNWGKMITDTQLEEWMTFCCAIKSLRTSSYRWKYQGLIEALKKEYKNVKS